MEITAVSETDLPLPKSGTFFVLKTVGRVPGQKTSTRLHQTKSGKLSSFGILVGQPIYIKRKHGCIPITSSIEKIYFEGKKIIVQSVASIYEIQ